MTSHLSTITLSALADGELSAGELAGVNEHLAMCCSCTSLALSQSLLKSATTRAGQRYTPPPDLQRRLAQFVAKEKSSLAANTGDSAAYRQISMAPIGSLGWMAAAAVLLIAISIGLVQRQMASSHRTAERAAALIAEVSDQHIAMLAGGSAPEVISTDRHTVKPWFQGKLPFSFNLPENLPTNTTLDGANLSYLGGRPVAQLLYSIGKHRVSVFVRERSASETAHALQTEHAGFHMEGFDTDDLELLAVSDVDPARLRELVVAIRQAQTGALRR